MKRKLNKILSVLLIVIVMGVSFIPFYGKAATIIITPSNSIQQALDQLEKQGGGTLILKAGTYTVGYSVKVPNNCTIQGESSTNRPIIKLASDRDEPVITNKYVPFNNVAAKNLIIDGGLTDSEQQYPAYYHKGSTEYYDRINSGAETQASLDAKIEAARLNRVGIDFSDKHNDVRNYNATIENCLIQRSSMGINVGRTTGVIIKNTEVKYCGAVQKYYHGLYISIVDQVTIDNLNASNNLTGIGLKICDFYGDQSETSISIKNSKFNLNYDRGLAAYDLQNIYVENNQANNNGKSGINLIRCKDGTLKNNTCLNNYYEENVSYDIWLNSCSNMTISGNTYGTKKGF